MKKYIKYVLIIVIIGAAYGFYMYNKPHKNLAKTTADYQLEATDLFTAYELNEEKSNELYLGKILEVSGVVRSISEEDGRTSIMLITGSDMFGVNCGMEPNAYSKLSTPVTEGQKIILRGFCTGMTMDVVLEGCVVVN